MEKEILFEGQGAEMEERDDSGHEGTTSVDELRTIWKNLCEAKRETKKSDIERHTKRFLRW